MSWQPTQLGNHFNIKHGYAFKGKYFSSSGRYIVLTPGNFYDEGGFKNRLNHPKYYSIDPPEEFILQKDDLIIAMTEQAEGLLGSSAIVPESDLYLHNQRLGLVINLNEKALNKKYLYYLMNTHEVRSQIRASATGLKVKHTAPKRILDVKVRLPDIKVQSRIASILSAYDNLIDNNSQRIALLEESMRLLYQEWFVRLRFPGYESVKVVDGLPEGWEKTIIDQSLRVLGGGTPSKNVEDYWANGEINWYTPTDLTKSQAMFADESLSKISVSGLENSSAKLFPPYSVMMTSRATIGAIAINNTEACTNQGFITCLPNERVTLYFLYHWLKEHVEVFIGHATGATFKEITKGVFRQLPITLPDPKVLQLYEETVKPMAECVFNLQRQNVRLTEARDMLLPRLMNREIAV